MSVMFCFKPFDTLIVFVQEFCEKVNFEKVSRRQLKHEKLPSMHRANRQQVILMSNSYLFVSFCIRI